MHLIRTMIIILGLCLLSSPVLAETYYVSPTGSQSDQKIINDAIDKAAEDGGGTVYLKAEGSNNVFVTNGPIVISSSNIILTGDSDATIQVYSGPGAKQWFTGKNSIICTNGPVDNIEIYGFQIDGNCEKLPFNFHHSRADTAHDCERAIYIAGQTGRFCNNIRIHDMQIYDCFSDGIHVRFANNVRCYENFISNCQHEGIFLVSVKNGLVESNEIAGITSDCARLDNCVNCIVQNNYFFSYSGDHNSMAPKGGANGIQIADAGASHGYDASKKPTSTTNIEVRWNTFANTGERAVWLDSTGKGYENVYIHDNKFVNVKAVTNPGRSVELNFEVTDTPTYHDVTGAVEPTRDTSKKIFSSIFDIFSMDFTTQAGNNDTVILPEGVKEIPSEAIGTITQYEQGNSSYTLVSVPTVGLSEVRYEVNGKEAVHTLMLGEKQGSKIVFSNCSMWSGDFDRIGDSLYLKGVVEPEDIEVTCVSPVNEFKPILEVEQVETPNRFFHPILKFVFMVIFGAIGFIYLNLKFAF